MVRDRKAAPGMVTVVTMIGVGIEIFRRRRNEVIVVQPNQDRRRDWDGGRSRYYEDRY